MPACRKHEAFAVFAVMSVAAWADVATATPPNYVTFGRQQKVDVAVEDSDLLRIWCVYVGQGDGILIQLPERRSSADASARVDILVDAGSYEGKFTREMTDFLHRIYPGLELTIEHAVLTHHDKDHVTGLTAVLKEPGIQVQHVYHNGLASFAAGARGLPKTGKPARRGVFEFDSEQNRIKRAMGLLSQTGDTFLAQYVMRDIPDLKRSVSNGELQGLYRDFAEAVLGGESAASARFFHRAVAGQPFIAEVETAEHRELDELRVELLWPRDKLRQYGDWGKTINGNSVTFRLVYRDFEMLFTGDHNELSEQAMLDHLQEQGELDTLRADVLKVPHHGSKHGIKEFFDVISPVISVASQGPQGARSKALGNSNAWEHPSPEVIGWLGGAHRVYLTQLHERRFDWADIDTSTELRELEETTHVLIETDGHWFRVVEVVQDWPDLDHPPQVQETLRSNGTRWISAR
jgi:beta-lactamase superfamily II metal-dependent hydrolase